MLVAMTTTFAAIAPIIGAVYIADIETKRQESTALEMLAHRAVSQAELVQHQAVSALQDVSFIRAMPCSEEYVQGLERVALAYRYVNEVGATGQGFYQCSSAVGDVHRKRIPFPASLGGEPATGYRLWTSPRNIYGKPLPAVFVSRDQHFAVIAPEMFVDLVDIGQRRIAVFDPISRKLIAATQGADAALMQSALDEHPARHGTTSRYVVKRSAKYPLAVVVQGKQVNAIANGGRLLAWCLLAGASVGVMLAWFVLTIILRQTSLPVALRKAIKYKRISAVYQPIVNMKTGEVVGVEALARWTRGCEHISPATFVPIAETHDLIEALTDLVARTALGELAPLLHTQPSLYVSLNLASCDLQHERFLIVLTELCSTFGVRPRQVRIEATERGFLETQSTRDTIRSFRRSGHLVLIDDFGTGYSSLSYLHRFEIDVLKIDKSFIDAIGKGAASSLVLEHIIAMAKALRFGLIAEGVETQEQAAYLQSHGVAHAQGWLYAKPMSIQDLAEHLRCAITPRDPVSPATVA